MRWKCKEKKKPQFCSFRIIRKFVWLKCLDSEWRCLERCSIKQVYHSKWRDVEWVDSKDIIIPFDKD